MRETIPIVLSILLTWLLVVLVVLALGYETKTWQLIVVTFISGLFSGVLVLLRETVVENIFLVMIFLVLSGVISGYFPVVGFAFIAALISGVIGIVGNHTNQYLEKRLENK